MTDPATLLLLFGVAFVASAVDAIAGGGGLLTLPSLLLAGLAPAAAIATNKVQSAFGATSATWVFFRRGLLSWPVSWAFVAAGVTSAALGAACAALLPREILAAMVPLVLVGVALYFAVARPPSEHDARARMPPLAFAALYVSAIGFYDGIFGPGTGSFLTIGFVTLMGYGLLRATAHTKLANAASNIGALLVFALAGKVIWPVGLVMAAGAVLGGQVGSRLALRHGARLIRPLLVTICCAMAIKLLADPANPVRHFLTRVTS